MAKFKPGESGNPSGRPPGSGVSPKLRKAIEKDAPEIIQALIARAKDGDVQAGRVLLDRVFPALKAQAMPVYVQLGENLPETGENVIAETLCGNVAPDVGSQLIRALAEQSKLIELEELTKRLKRIEKQLETRQQ